MLQKTIHANRLLTLLLIWSTLRRIVEPRHFIVLLLIRGIDGTERTTNLKSSSGMCDSRIPSPLLTKHGNTCFSDAFASFGDEIRTHSHESTLCLIHTPFPYNHRRCIHTLFRRVSMLKRALGVLLHKARSSTLPQAGKDSLQAISSKLLLHDAE